MPIATLLLEPGFAQKVPQTGTDRRFYVESILLDVCASMYARGTGVPAPDPTVSRAPSPRYSATAG